jgi:hypothetical protein
MIELVIPNAISMKFSFCSEIFNGFQHVSHTSLLYPISFALIFILVTLYNQSKGKDSTYLFWDHAKLDSLKEILSYAINHHDIVCMQSTIMRLCATSCCL